MESIFDELRTFVKKHLQPSREQALALTKIDEAEMWYDLGKRVEKS